MPDAAEPTYYNSIYHHGVDEKRRVQIPSKWRPSAADVQFTLILWRNGKLPDACLLVLPPEQAQALAKKLTDMSFSDPKAETLRRILGTRSDRVMLDKSGRICLPEPMAQAAGIQTEAVLVGLWDRFEIWNPERYQAASLVDEALSSEALALI